MLWIEHIVVGCLAAFFLKRRDSLSTICIGSILPDLPMVLFLWGVDWSDDRSSTLTSVRYMYFLPHSLLILPCVPSRLMIYYLLHILCDIVSHTGVWGIQPIFPLSNTSINGFYDPWKLLVSLSPLQK